MARFDFIAKNLQWEVVSSGVKLLIVVTFDNIAGCGLEHIDGCDVLTLEYSRPPQVKWEGARLLRLLSFAEPLTMNAGCQPAENRLSRFKRHALHFERGSLNRPVELMLRVDERLRELANLGLPSLDDPCFSDDTREANGNGGGQQVQQAAGDANKM